MIYLLFLIIPIVLILFFQIAKAKVLRKWNNGRCNKCGNEWKPYGWQWDSQGHLQFSCGCTIFETHEWFLP